MNEMVERVAEAIEAIRAYKEDISIVATPEELARAAIAAMREPTEAMMLMGTQVIDMGYGDDDGGAIWRAMIDAALKE